MPITLNSFKCSNGHSFEANAKLRARCPSCGVSTKRSFTAAVAEVLPKPDPEVEPKVEPKESKPKAVPVLVRRGRPREVKEPIVEPEKPKLMVAKKKPNFKPIGSKVSAGLVKSTTIKKRGAMPVVNRRPPKTAVARGIEGHEQKTPYWHEVANKYGF